MSTPTFEPSLSPVRNLQALLGALVVAVGKILATFEICATQVLFNHDVRVGKIETASHKVAPTAAATALATGGAGTYLAAALLSGIITRDPAGANRTDTTDTAANLVAGLGLTANYQEVFCLIVNTADGAETITLAGGTGVTLQTAITIARYCVTRLSIVRTSSTTVCIREV